MNKQEEEIKQQLLKEEDNINNNKDNKEEDNNNNNNINNLYQDTDINNKDYTRQTITVDNDKQAEEVLNRLKQTDINNNSNSNNNNTINNITKTIKDKIKLTTRDLLRTTGDVIRDINNKVFIETQKNIAIRNIQKQEYLNQVEPFINFLNELEKNKETRIDYINLFFLLS